MPDKVIIMDDNFEIVWLNGRRDTQLGTFFGTTAKELHGSLDLFGTLHKANELQQYGNSSSSELTSIRTAQNCGLIILSGFVHSSLTLR